MKEPSEQTHMLTVFLDWLDEEAADGYANSVSKWGVVELVRDYSEYLPQTAITALAYYDTQSPEKRQKAINVARAAVLKHVAVSSADATNHDGEYTDGVGLHPDFLTWSGMAGVRGQSSSPISANARSVEKSNLSVTHLRTMPYQEYLKTDHWHRVRRAALSRAENRCQLCNSPVSLQVHHRTYERRGDERESDVIVLCDSCHSTFHETHPGFTRRKSAAPASRSRPYRARATKRANDKNFSYKKWMLTLAALAVLVLGLSGYSRSKETHDARATAPPATGAPPPPASVIANATTDVQVADHLGTEPATVLPPTPIPQATPRYSPGQVMFGSWVAYSKEIGVRFFAPPSIIEKPDSHSSNAYALRSPSDHIGGGYEVLDILRLRNRSSGDTPGTWKAQNDAFLTAIEARDYSVTLGPSPQRIGDYVGQRGQFNYAQSSNGLRISGTMWVGQVDSDIVVIIYRCEPEREYWLDREMTQIMDTIDFNAH